MDNSEPHPLDPDSLLNTDEREIFSWLTATKASTFATYLRAEGKHICVGRDCPHQSHTIPLPDAALARSGDPKVSHVAADSIQNMKERHRAVLQIAQTFADTFTYEELEYRYNKRRDEGYQHGKKSSTFVLDLPPMKGSSVRSRAAELRHAGWLEQAGRGLSDAGRPCNTWRVIR